MPVFNFGMWSQIGDHLDSVPIHKIKIKSSESEPGGCKITGDGSHLSFNQFQPSPALAPIDAPVDSLVLLFKPNPAPTDKDSESRSKSENSDMRQIIRILCLNHFKNHFQFSNLKLVHYNIPWLWHKS
jgi:hypothetical protein